MSRARKKPLGWSGRSLSAASWLLVVGLPLGLLVVGLSGGRWWVVGLYGGALLVLIVGTEVGRSLERRRWSDPLRSLCRNLEAFNAQPDEAWDLPATPELAELVRPVKNLQERYLALRGELESVRYEPAAGGLDTEERDVTVPFDARMTRSGSFEPPSFEPSMLASGEVSTLEMINRLEPRTLRWLTSTLAEQEFLGWSIAELKKKSFLEIVQDDDRKLARQELRTVLDRGEGHGLIYRITTATGATRAVELNIGVRYGPDQKVLHLRCHLTDVTAKLRDESELKRRTQELTQANDVLRRTNRELRQLKDRYSDLYENAPAMYFTVDRRGRIRECNDRLVQTLGYSKDWLIGRSVLSLLPESRTSSEDDRFLLPGPLQVTPSSVEFASEWVRSDGSPRAVWVTRSATLGTDGQVRQWRCVAQDVTARRNLEAELQVKNERLARANVELLTKNKELDEFTHVVSHDLQEPLRTLIAFSDFLLRDHADKLDESGQDYVRYLVEASKRLRSLIKDLLELSRAGKVTADFAAVALTEVVEVVKADLSELVRTRGAEITSSPDLPEVWGDRDRIGQLVANLVGNGLKYNQSPAPKVEIRARIDDPEWVTIAIQDNGIGIDTRYHSRIFQLFRRLHTREEYDGTGAGLAICQKIVQAHGGRIWVESQAGTGSTFFVKLRRTRPVAETIPLDAASPLSDGEEPRTGV